MFSPNYRMNHAQENEDAISRKPEFNPTGTRKPFVDRSVNETPFEKNKKKFPTRSSLLAQEKCQGNKIKTPQKKYPDWLLDTCSYKEVFDDCWDIPFRYNQALQEGLAAYFQPKTPPPILKSIDTFLELPPLNILRPESPLNCCEMDEIDEEPPIPLIEIEF